MATAKDFDVSATIQHKANKNRKGTVIGNSLSDGDQVVAIEWEDGSLGKMNVNAIQVCLSMEEEFKLFQGEVNDKLAQAAKLIREAATMAESKGKDLLDYDSDTEDGMFNTYQIETAMSAAGWNTSSWHR